MPQKRFFLSYSRRAEADSALAQALVEGLGAAGHDVFIDLDIPMGSDWAALIAERIEWCDALVVLLSAVSVDSEMVQGEIRLAHHRRRADGTPRIMPVRVRFDGRLDYELSSYLDRLQYHAWRGPEDTAPLLARIIASVEGEIPAPGCSPAGRAGRREGRADLPAADPRATRPPTGAMDEDDPFYVVRGADRALAPLAAGGGETVVIKGPRQIGKSSLLNRWLAACEDSGKRTVWLDFQSLTDAQMADYPTLLRCLAAGIVEDLKLVTDGAEGVDSHGAFTDFVEDAIVGKLDGPLTLAFDEADRILGRPYQRDFFALLRLWHNRRARRRSPWKRVDIAIVIATEPYLLIDTADQSPFNVGLAVTLEPFGDADLQRLNALSDRPLDDPQLDDLAELLGGHPYLTRWAFYRLVAPPAVSFADLQAHAADRDGPFGEHLKALLLKLQQHPQLLPAMQQAIAVGSVPDDDAFFRLRGAGLVRQEEGRVVPANMLYARFFKGIA